MASSKQIKVAFKKDAGFEVIVPVCPVAKLFAKIARSQTLTKPAIADIQALGYKVNVVQTVRSV